jgi:hypothetical protein
MGVCKGEGYWLKDRMTSLGTFPFLVLDFAVCLLSSKPGLIDKEEVCAQEVSRSLKGTKKKI